MEEEAVALDELEQREDRPVGAETLAAGIGLGAEAAQEDRLHQLDERRVDDPVADRHPGDEPRLGIADRGERWALRPVAAGRELLLKAGELLVASKEKPGDVGPAALARHEIGRPRAGKSQR